MSWICWNRATGVYVLYQMYGGYPLFDVKLKLHVTDGEVRAYSQSHAEILGAFTGEQQKVLSGLRAVGILAWKNWNRARTSSTSGLVITGRNSTRRREYWPRIGGS